MSPFSLPRGPRSPLTVLTERLISATCLLGACWLPGSSPCLCGVCEAMYGTCELSHGGHPSPAPPMPGHSQGAQLKDAPLQCHFPLPRAPLPPTVVSKFKGPVSLYSAAGGWGGGAGSPPPPASGKAPFGFGVPPAGGRARPLGATSLLPHLTLSFPPGKRPSWCLS